MEQELLVAWCPSDAHDGTRQYLRQASDAHNETRQYLRQVDSVAEMWWKQELTDDGWDDQIATFSELVSKCHNGSYSFFQRLIYQKAIGELRLHDTASAMC